MKPDGYRGKGHRQSLHSPNISVLLCLTVFSTKGSFNVQALDLSQEFEGLSLCFSLCCDVMFSLHKGKTVTFSFIFSSSCLAHVCLAFIFPSAKQEGGGEPKEAFELMVEYFSLGRLWERSCASVLFTVLEACSVFVHLLFLICCLFFFFFLLIVSLCRFLHTQGAKLHRSMEIHGVCFHPVCWCIPVSGVPLRTFGEGWLS